MAERERESQNFRDSDWNLGNLNGFAILIGQY